METSVSPAVVWQAWERGLEQKRKFSYEILEVKKGEGFSIRCKALFIRLIFTHTVKPTPRGSEICYKAEIKGFFAWPVRWILGQKIKKNLGMALKAVVYELENKRVK